MQDHPKDQGEELIEFILAEGGQVAQPISISANLSVDLRQALRSLLREFRNVFVWTYAKMLGVDSQFAKHQLNIREGIKPFKQASMNSRLDLRC